jgi:hypothetical protein
MEYLLEKMEDWKAFFDDSANAAISQASQTSSRGRRRRCQPPPSFQALPEHARCEYLNLSPLQRLENMSEDSRLYFRLSVTNGWKKLNEYYTKLEDSPLYAAAMILHPRLNIRWLEKTWTEEAQCSWLRTAKEGILNYWSRWYRDSQPPSTSRPSTPQGANLVALPGLDSSQFDDWVYTRSQVSNQAQSELDCYLAISPSQLQDVSDPLA